METPAVHKAHLVTMAHSSVANLSGSLAYDKFCELLSARTVFYPWMPIIENSYGHNGTQKKKKNEKAVVHIIQYFHERSLPSQQDSLKRNLVA